MVIPVSRLMTKTNEDENVSILSRVFQVLIHLFRRLILLYGVIVSRIQTWEILWKEIALTTKCQPCKVNLPKSKSTFQKCNLLKSEKRCFVVYAWFSSCCYHRIPVPPPPQAHPREAAIFFPLNIPFPTPGHAERDNSAPPGLFTLTENKQFHLTKKSYQ